MTTATNTRASVAAVATTVDVRHVTLVASNIKLGDMARWEIELQQALAHPDPGPTFENADDFLNWLSEQ